MSLVQFKGTNSVNRTYVCQKVIPGFGSCYSKWPGAKVRDSWADDEFVYVKEDVTVIMLYWSHCIISTVNPLMVE